MRQNLITRQQEVALNFTYKNFGLNNQFSPFEQHSSTKFNPSDKRSKETQLGPTQVLFHIQALEQHPTPRSSYRRGAEKALESNLDGSKMLVYVSTPLQQTHHWRFEMPQLGRAECIACMIKFAIHIRHICVIIGF
jgi:hypothetical protein